MLWVLPLARLSIPCVTVGSVSYRDRQVSGLSISSDTRVNFTAIHNKDGKLFNHKENLMAFFGLPLAKIGVAGLSLIGKAFAVPLIAAVGVPAIVGGVVGAGIIKAIK